MANSFHPKLQPALFTGLVLKKIESVIVHSSMKQHFKTEMYSRDPSSIRKYLNYFEKTSLDLFKPKNSSDKELRWTKLSDSHFLYERPTPYTPISIFKESFENPLKTLNVHVMPFHKSYKNGKQGFKKAKRAILYFHGWGRSSFTIEQLWQFKLFQHAYHADIYAPELPYHHNRNPRGFSGQGFLDADPVRTIEAFRQATIEGCSILSELTLQYDSVAMIGVSLGGHISVMINLLDLFPNEPLFTISCLVGSPLKSNFKNLTISPNLLQAMKNREVMEALTILDFNKIPVKRINDHHFLFGGKYDSLISPESVLNLGKHLKAKTYLVPSGHFTFPVLFPYILHKIAKWPDS